MQNDSAILDRLCGLNVWKREESRAPNKPLLVLLALAKLQQGEGRLIQFSDIEKPLRELLIKYGVDQVSPGPQYPFWRLQNDGIWEIPNGAELTRRQSNSDVPITVLRREDVKGGFVVDLFEALRANPKLIELTATRLLEQHFPESLHSDILDDIGLSLGLSQAAKARDPAFRKNVLDAYGWKCAICGFDAHLSGKHFGVEAAHIHWHSHNGPDVVTNGIALCALHHKSFDLGAISIDSDYRLILSQGLVGHESYFHAYHEKMIQMPNSRASQPAKKYLDWHRTQVFRSPGVS